MNYISSYKELNEKLYNKWLEYPFDKISQEDISNAINNLDFFEQEHDEVNKNNIRRIAYLVGNPQLQNLKIENAQCLSQHELLAINYSQNSQFIITTDEALDLAKTDMIPQYYQTNKFSWDKLELNLVSPWEDEDYIIEKLKNNKVLASYDLNASVAKISSKLLLDEKFIDRLINETPHVIKTNINEKFIFNPIILNKMLNNENLFYSLFEENHYKILTYSNTERELRHMEKHSIKDALKQQQLEDEILLINEIRQKIIDNMLNKKHVVLELLDKKLFDIYPYVEKDLKYDEDVLYKICAAKQQDKRSVYWESYIESEKFKDDKFVEFYIKNYLPYTNFTDYPHTYKPWISDKNKILSYGKLTQTTYRNGEYHDSFTEVFNLMDKSLKKDIEVISMFIKKDPNIYNKLSKSMRMNKNLLMIYIEDNHYKKADFIPMQLLETFSVEELKKVVSCAPKIFFQENVPSSWFENIELVGLCGEYFTELIKNPKAKNLIDSISSREDLCINIVKADMKNYLYLNDKARGWESVALAYLSHEHFRSSKEWEIFPKQLLVSTKVCLKLLKSSYKDTPEILPQMWNNKEFILEIGKLIDDKTMSLNVLNKGPVSLKNAIDLYNIKPGKVVDFLSKYLLQASLTVTLNENVAPKKKMKI